LELNKIIEKPILLWGLNELPYDGGKIRLNSVCGVNLNASNLYKAGIRFHYVIGDDIDQDWLDAIRIIKAFKTAHIGLMGYRAKGFFNLDVDELDLYRELGVLIDHYELDEVFNYEIDDNNKNKVSERLDQLKSDFDVSELTEEQIKLVSELIVKFRFFMVDNNLNALAIRCWPEFAATYGISPCAAMSILQSEDLILTCEGDIMGSLSMLAQKAIGGKTPYLADFSQVNLEEDFALLWHCGVAPSNLSDDNCVKSLDTYFAGGKGVTMGFVMKSGDISILRLDYALGEYRAFIQKGRAIPMEKLLKGTYAKVKFNDAVRTVLNKIIKNGIAHHVSVVYGNYTRPIELFTQIKGWNLIH
jgi:L-fucose isomerase-like protein